MTKQRLLDRFVPAHYDLYLDINRATKSIQGRTTVTGEAKAAHIALNQKFLNVTAVSVDGTAVPFDLDAEKETLEIDLPTAGTVTVVIDYNTRLTDTMMGIYPSYYQVDGQKKQLIGTQFETTFARQAFPCVDEPAAKATFALAIK